MARRLADLDVGVNTRSADRVNLHLQGVGRARSLRRERAVHDGADLGLEVSGAYHCRDRLVYLPGERGGYLILNSVPRNRRRAPILTWALQPATSQPPAVTATMKARTCLFPLSMRSPPRQIMLAYQALLTWLTVLVKDGCQGFRERGGRIGPPPHTLAYAPRHSSVHVQGMT